MIVIPNAEIVAQSDRLLSLKLPVFSVPAVVLLVSKCKEGHGGFISARFERPSKPRTTGKKSQNHKLNGGISQFCNETGNDFDDIKLFLKRRAMRRGLQAKTDVRGNIVYSKVDGEPLPKSEADMNTVECSWVIEEMEQFFAEEGFVPIEERIG